MNRADLYPSSAVTPFQARLRELGYIEGQTITFETRYWEGTVERLPEVASELVRLNCHVIFTTGSLAQPGGNVKGLTSGGAEFKGKQLEILKEVVPRLSRVGYCGAQLGSVNSQDWMVNVRRQARGLTPKDRRAEWKDRGKAKEQIPQRLGH